MQFPNSIGHKELASRLFLPVVLAVLASAVTASAHHSFSQTYTGKLVRLEGKVVELDIRNPHSFINFEVTDKNGKTTRWAAEWGSASQLREGGVTGSILKPGDKIIVEGATARDPMDHKVLIRSVVRPATGATPEFKWPGGVQ
jgi:hypothetical protein